MKVVITGATGFIGTHLANRLIEEGHKVVSIGRNIDKCWKKFGSKLICAEWDLRSINNLTKHLKGADAIINLAGENVGRGPWTEEKKDNIFTSRQNALTALLDAVNSMDKKPEIIIHGSAIGYYGDEGERYLTEDKPVGKEFLSEVTAHCEKIFSEENIQGIRKVIIRTAVVLGHDGGAFPRMSAPFRYLMGYIPGNGEQFISWIHIEDEINAILFLLKNKQLDGVFNLSSPNPVKAQTFFRIIGKVLKSPVWGKMPKKIITFFGGNKAEELIISSKRVMPERLKEAGFKFKYPDLEEALKSISHRKS